MPCNDVTDRLSVTLDEENRITNYTLAKRTCGAEVGDFSLIASWINGRGIDDVLATPPDRFLDTMPPTDDMQEFLFLKHFFSLQNGLEAFLGKPRVEDAEHCTIDHIEYSPERMTFVASIQVDLVTSQIKACGGCRKCRTLSV